MVYQAQGSPRMYLLGAEFMGREQVFSSLLEGDAGFSWPTLRGRAQIILLLLRMTGGLDFFYPSSGMGSSLILEPAREAFPYVNF